MDNDTAGINQGDEAGALAQGKLLFDSLPETRLIKGLGHLRGWQGQQVLPSLGQNLANNLRQHPAGDGIASRLSSKMVNEFVYFRQLPEKLLLGIVHRIISKSADVFRLPVWGGKVGLLLLPDDVLNQE
jgi:hypothetical protein